MDIDKIVSDLMKAERMPLTKMNQQKQLLSWKTDRYREINTQLSTFRDFLNGMRFTGSWTQSKTASSDPTTVTASADATATPGTHTIIVNNLASGAQKVSSNGISIASLTGSVLSGSTAITTGTNDKMNITLNGVNKTITLAAGTYTNAALQTTLQSAIDTAFGANQITVGLVGGNKLSLTPVGTAGSLPQIIVGAISGNTGITALGFTDQQSFKINVNAQLGVTPTKLATALTFGDFIINGQSISYTSTDTLATIMSKVNNSAAGVNMTYDSITDKVSFTTKGTGVAAKVQLANGASGNFITAMNLNTTAATGSDASVTIDGVNSSRSTNSFTLNGVTYNLLAITNAGAVTVTVNRDTDYIFNKIKDFVTKYNDTIGLTTQRLKEVKFRDYPPLTDEQKLNMKDSEIKLWEDRAKSGLLRNDDILSNFSTSIRSFTTSTVQSISTTYNSLYKVGITSVPYNSSAPNDAGKLQLDESKLRAAIAQDPDGVISLFSNQPANGVTSNKGIAQAMYDQANTSITSLIKRAGGIGTAADNINTDLGFQLSNLGTKISKFNSKLASIEANYYRKFGAMDQAMQKSNSQLSWLSQQFK
jgi:flagellar hook-associated protein 2